MIWLKLTFVVHFWRVLVSEVSPSLFSSALVDFLLIFLQFELHTDDIAGIRRLYPLREGTTGATESSVNFSDDEPPPISSSSTPSPSATRLPFPTRPPFRTRFSSPRTGTTSSSHTIFTGTPPVTPSTTTTTPPGNPVRDPGWMPPSTTSVPGSTTRRHPTSPLFYNANEPLLETLDDDVLPSRHPLSPGGASTDPSTATAATSRKSPKTPTHAGKTTLFITDFTTNKPARKSTPEGATVSSVGTTTIPTTGGLSTPNAAAVSNRTAAAGDYPDLCDAKFTIDAVTTCEGIGYLFSGNNSAEEKNKRLFLATTWWIFLFFGGQSPNTTF